MRLNEALVQIATDAELDANQLIEFARQDNVGGRDTGDWPGMSTFSDEGKVIYALVRALRPTKVVEVGVDSGGTSTHILSALEANQHGKLWSIDINPDCGRLVPEQLKHRWTFVTGDALTAELPEQADFIFEDGEHGYAFTETILKRLRDLNPRILVSHDYYTHLVYGDSFQVQQAFSAVLGDHGVLIDGAFTGLGYWINPDYAAQQEALHNFDHSFQDEPRVNPNGIPKPEPKPVEKTVFKNKGGRPRKALK